MAASNAEILRLNPAAPETLEWESKLDLIRRTVAAGATNDELELFFHQARRSGLDPLARQIYFVKRKGRGVVQVGIDGLRLIADRTGSYAGSDDAEHIGTTDGGYPAKARVTVYKMVQGQRCPFTATARWDEYYPGDEQGFMWRKMPHTMLAKVAEALALRKAFPNDMSGLYAHEEMEQADAQAERAAPSAGEPALEGASLREVIEKTFASGKSPRPAAGAKPAALVAPDGKAAFAYEPVRWPLPKMFQEPATEQQKKMLLVKARERTIPEELVAGVQRAVLAEYGLEDDGSKGAASLAIDWLMNADEDSLDRAVGAVEAELENREQLELSVD